MDRGVWLFLLLAPIGAALLVRLTLRWLLGPPGGSGEVSLTQPLPVFEAPPFDVVAPLRSRLKYSRRKWCTRHQPLFTRSGWIALALFLCYLMFDIPIWAIIYYGSVRTGIFIHLWKPVAQTNDTPALPVLVVRFALHGHQKRPDLFVDSEPVTWPELETALRAKLVHYPPHWPIYLDGDPNMDWQYAVEVTETIHSLKAEVIFLKHQQSPAKMRDH